MTPPNNNLHAKEDVYKHSYISQELLDKPKRRLSFLRKLWNIIWASPSPSQHPISGNTVTSLLIKKIVSSFAFNQALLGVKKYTQPPYTLTSVTVIPLAEFDTDVAKEADSLCTLIRKEGFSIEVEQKYIQKIRSGQKKAHVLFVALLSPQKTTK